MLIFTAICEPGCVHGLCIEPDVCQCDNGYNGTYCEERK